MCLFAWLKLRRKDGSYKVKKNKILEFLGKNKFPLITKSSESNTAWEDPSPSNIEDAMLKEKCKIDLCVVRITGSSNIIIFRGISLSRWSELMKEEGESADADIASCYYHWFLRGIHVVTTTQDKSGQVLDICFNKFSRGS
ncbi:unnamed protein product, partial [Brassica rapa]